jgi:hypothetical protein
MHYTTAPDGNGKPTAARLSDACCHEPASGSKPGGQPQHLALPRGLEMDSREMQHNDDL